MIELVISTDGKAHEEYHARSTDPYIEVPQVRDIRHGRTVWDTPQPGEEKPSGTREYAHVFVTREQAEAIIETLREKIAEGQ
jgi:hypothetical protein